MKNWALLVLLGLWSGGANSLTAVDGERLEAIYAVDQLVLDGAHECVLFQVYLAEESWQKARGLMFVAELPDNWGMIFRYGSARRFSMYMKNTLIPLDMVFFAEDGSIVDIAENTTPGSLTSIAPAAPAVAVLEINAGLSKQLGFKKGHKLLSDSL
jgi:uncharacterized membrane protein (UPF0127 family)